MLRVSALALLLVFGLNAVAAAAVATQDQLSKKEAKELFKKKEGETDLKDAEAVFALALWAKENNLTVEYKRMLRKVIKIDPDHEKARDLLGYQKYEGEWKSKRQIERLLREKEEAEKRAQGLVKYQGEWIPKEEADALEKGLVKYEGKWVTPEQKERLEKGLQLYDGMWMSKDDIEKYKQGLYNVNDQYVTKDQADKLHSDLADPWVFEGDYFVMKTNNKLDLGRDCFNGAETAWVNAHQMIGVQAKPVEEGQLKPLILVVATSAEYMEEGNAVQDDFDALKSSCYSEFCKVDPESGLLRAVVVYANNEMYTTLMARQAAAELALRSYPFAEPPPRWIVEGIACYQGRFWDPRLVSWSKENLRSRCGGLVKMKNFFDAFLMDEQNILNAGLLFAYLNSEDCDSKVTEAWEAVKKSLTSEKADGLERSLMGIGRAFARAERKLGKYLDS